MTTLCFSEQMPSFIPDLKVKLIRVQLSWLSWSGCLNVNPDRACQVQFDAKLQAEMSHVSRARCGVHYVMHNFIPSTLMCADASCFVCVSCMLRSRCMRSLSPQGHFLCVSVCFCVCVFVTWPCQSIFQCRPFHRQLPAPGPEIQWPHPQTAASVSTHTHTHTHAPKHASYSKLKFANTKSMKKSCCQDSGCSVNTVCH